MATWSIKQVLPGSVDSLGVSTVTSSCDTTDPRRGQAYDPTLLAAGAFVWFHPLPDGKVLGLLSRHLSAAVTVSPQPGGPLLYSSSQSTSVPSWVVFDPTTGSVFDSPQPIPSLLAPGDGRVLSAAASRGSYLFVLSRVGGDEALVQHFRVGSRSDLTLEAEEMVPAGLGLGLLADQNDLWVIGARDGKLAMARKNWGRIGENRSLSPFFRWRFQDGRRWSAKEEDLSPMPGDIPATGPVSVARWRSRYYLSSPVRDAEQGRWSAKFWSGRLVDSWRPFSSFSVDLGADKDYLGGTAHLQPSLSLTPGFQSTPTSRGETVLDSGSDTGQVFTGWASHTVVMPDLVSPVRDYTIYNMTVTGELSVVSASGQPVITVRPGTSVVLTPSSSSPVDSASWSSSEAVRRVPQRRKGFPYVATRRLSADTGNTLIPDWGAFVV